MQPNSDNTKILLIEDNDIDVELIKRIAKRQSMDYPIVRARNGIEALEILNRPTDKGLLQPYIVLLDINMPMMNGFELLEHLAQHGPAVDVPIYILSTSESEKDINKSKQYKISGYLVKPLTRDVLEEIMDDKASWPNTQQN